MGGLLSKGDCIEVEFIHGFHVRSLGIYTMQCIRCGTKINGEGPLCPFCTKQMEKDSGTGTIDPQVITELQKKETPSFAFFAPAIFLGFLITEAGAYIAYHAFSGESIGFGIGTALLPFIAAFLVAGVGERRNAWIFSGLFIGLCVMAAVMSVVHAPAQISNLDMMRMIAGTKPINESLSHDDKALVTSAHKLVADLSQFRTQNQKEVVKAMSELKDLNSSTSFESRAESDKLLATLNRIDLLGSDMKSRINEIPNQLKVIIDSSKMSDEGKEELTNAMLKQFSDSATLVTANQFLNDRGTWIHAEIDLYNYVRSREQKFKVQNGKVVVNDSQTRDEFNQLIRNSNAAQRTMKESAKKFDDARAADMKAQGATSKDLGITQ